MAFEAPSCQLWGQVSKLNTRKLLLRLVTSPTMRLRNMKFASNLLSQAARLAQSVEHETLNLRVVGSSPTWGEKAFFIPCVNFLFKQFSRRHANEDKNTLFSQVCNNMAHEAQYGGNHLLKGKQEEIALWTGVEGHGSIHYGDGTRGIRQAMGIG